MERTEQSALVLGGTGFVGGHICRSLLDAGYDVTSISRRCVSPGWHHVSQDLVSVTPAQLADVIANCRPDVVVNAAGTYWSADLPAMTAAFSGITEKLVAAIQLVDFTPRVVHLGSVMEYAPTPNNVATDESTPTQPVSEYGQAKLAATKVVTAACTAELIDGVVLRVTNNIGPGAHRRSLLGMVASSLAKAEKSGSTATLELSPMQAHRDYLDVRDLGAVVVAAATRGKSGDVVNIGTGTAVPVRDLVDRLIEISGVHAHVEELESAPKSPGSSSVWLQVDTTTALSILGWKAQRGIDDALLGVWQEARG